MVSATTLFARSADGSGGGGVGPLVRLLLLSGAMLAGSLAAGSVPLAVQLSDARLRLLSTFGSGLLVGTALIVIVPEGVATLYAAAELAAAGAAAPPPPPQPPFAHHAVGEDASEAHHGGGSVDGRARRPPGRRAALPPAAWHHGHGDDDDDHDARLDGSEGEGSGGGGGGGGAGYDEADGDGDGLHHGAGAGLDDVAEQRANQRAKEAAAAAVDAHGAPEPAAAARAAAVAAAAADGSGWDRLEGGSGGRGAKAAEDAGEAGGHHATHNHAHAHGSSSSSSNAHSAIGLPMVLGFLFMLLVDQFAERLGPGDASHIAISEFRTESGTDLAGVGGSVGGGDAGVVKPLDAGRPTQAAAAASLLAGGAAAFRGLGKSAATLGLVVHAAADGVALGAATAADRGSGLGLIVFLAIMLHKAPTAFGLTAHLLREGASRRTIRQHLALFSAAAPAAALASFWLARGAGAGGLDGSGDAAATAAAAARNVAWTGSLLLFSAGSFLYVATMHVLPGVFSPHAPAAGGAGSQPHAASTASSTRLFSHAHGGRGHGHRGSGGGGSGSLSVAQIAALAAGMFTPYFLMVE
ncbi:hypothetical protein HK405_004303, partial [Cladochytrium tenue]